MTLPIRMEAIPFPFSEILLIASLPIRGLGLTMFLYCPPLNQEAWRLVPLKRFPSPEDSS
jgi:hypothetical protein